MRAPVRRRTARHCLLAWVLTALAANAAAADDRSGREFFEAKIRPVLAGQCFKCHSARSGKPKGGLRLDTREGLRRGGTSGPAVVPGDPDASPLLQAIARSGDLAPMPPRAELPKAVVADFRRWVAMGAPDPRGDAAEKPAIDPLDWWSLRPLEKPPVPGHGG